jgi:hypothetical protein
MSRMEGSGKVKVISQFWQRSFQLMAFICRVPPLPLLPSPIELRTKIVVPSWNAALKGLLLLHVFWFINRYILHSIGPNSIRMYINPGSQSISQPTHATLTVESTNPETNQKQVKRFNCEYDGCSRTYSTVGNLKTHLKTHKVRDSWTRHGKHLSFNICIYHPIVIVISIWIRAGRIPFHL